MADPIRVLIVEDEASIRTPLVDYLTSEKFDVHEAEDAEEARKLLQQFRFDLAVLDIMMPGEDGLSLCRHVQDQHGTPVILVTARSGEMDRIIGLEIGADDYVTKPFNPRELLARIRAVHRRSTHGGRDDDEGSQDRTSYAFESWILRTDERVLIGRDGVATSLSTGEFNLLLIMLQKPRVVLSRDRLLELSRNRTADVFDRSIDNMVSRIRRKIEDNPKEPKIIKTIWGGGYMLSADVVAE